MSNSNINNIKEMNLTEVSSDLNKLTKTELLTKCDELGIKNCKSKTKSEIIQIINDKKSPPKKKINLIIEDDESDSEIY